MSTATKTALEHWMSDREFFDRCQVAGRTFNVVSVAFEVYEALKLQSFPPAETARFLRMLEAFGKENPGLLCIAEATRISTAGLGPLYCTARSACGAS